MPTHLTELLRGTMTEGVLCTLLGKLHGARRTGTLRLTGVELSAGAPRVASRALTFLVGDVVGIESNVDSEALGPVLLRCGSLTSGDLMRAGVHARESRQGLEWALQDLGLLKPERRRDAFVEQAIEALTQVFAWSDGVYTFEERDVPAPLPDAPRMGLGELVGRVVERLADADVERALGDPSRPFVAGPRPPDAAHATFEDLGLLEAADGRKPMRQLLAAARCPAPEGHRRVLLLLSTGALAHVAPPADARDEPAAAVDSTLPAAATGAVPTPPAARPPAAPAPPPAAAKPAPVPAAEKTADERRAEILAAHAALLGASHFEVLGVPRTATEAEIKSAYGRLARQYHPDTQSDPALSDLRDKLVALFVAVGEAHQALRDPSRRATYQAALLSANPQSGAAAPAPEAGGDPVEEYILRAHASLARKDANDAVQILEYVLNMPEVRPDLRKAARLLLAKAYRQNPRWSKEAERVLLDIVGDDPAYVPGYFALGNLYKERGMNSRALRMFRRVVQLEPLHAGAQEEIVALG